MKWASSPVDAEDHHEGKVHTMSQIMLAELEATAIEILPARETLAFISANWTKVKATNVSVAVNLMTNRSAALSSANQTILVFQH